MTVSISAPFPNQLPSGPQPQTETKAGRGFDAALKAAQQAAQRAEEHQRERAAIVEKGFSTWVRDMRVEKLKEELRKRAMAAMGVDADSLGRLDATMRKIIEQKIEEEVNRLLAETMDQEGDGKANSAAATQPGKKNLPGISCPVIPALAEPGGASIL